MDKQQIINHYMGIVQQVKDGEVNALDVAPDLKEFADSISELYDEIKEDIIEERDKYSDKEEVIRGGYLITTQTRTYPQYKQDDEYAFIKQKLKNRKELIKKATAKGKTLTDSETGETVQPVDQKVRRYPMLKFVGEQL